MAHEKVFGVCENKCFVEVETKENTDAVEQRVSTLESYDLDNRTTSLEGRATSLEGRMDTAETRLDRCVIAGETVEGNLQVTGGFVGNLYRYGELTTNQTNILYFNPAAQSMTCTSSSSVIKTQTLTVNSPPEFPIKVSTGIYVADETFITNKEILPEFIRTGTLTVTIGGNSYSNTRSVKLYVNGATVDDFYANGNMTKTYTFNPGDVVTIETLQYRTDVSVTAKLSIPMAGTSENKFYLNVL